jgi:hypothetical protein
VVRYWEGEMRMRDGQVLQAEIGLNISLLKCIINYIDQEGNLIMGAYTNTPAEPHESKKPESSEVDASNEGDPARGHTGQISEAPATPHEIHEIAEERDEKRGEELHGK